MQTFTLIRAFRDWEIGTEFTKDTFNVWTADGSDVSGSICDTLLEVGGYFEETTPTEFTPTSGQTFFFITGAGEIKSKEWTNSDWCNAQRSFLGVFATRELAEERRNQVSESLNALEGF